MAGKSAVKYPYWQEIVNRQAESGLSIRAFCRDEGISEPSFYLWRRKLRDGTNGVRAKRTKRREDDSNFGGEFIPLALMDASEPVEVVHPLGYRIRITGGVDVAVLDRILDVLDGRVIR